MHLRAGIAGALAVLVLLATAFADEEDIAETGAGAGTCSAAAPDDAVVTGNADATGGMGGASPVSGEEAHGVVAFTFDDGPKAGTTNRVMDALIEYDVPATFFVVGNRLVGKRADKAKVLLARMVKEGFEVGNHTYSHEQLKALNEKSMIWQIDRTTKVIEKLTGKDCDVFRPPYGSSSKKSSAHVHKVGLTSVMWNIDSLDWRRPDPDRMREAIVEAIFRKDGGVVLMHDTKKITATTIHGILDDLEARNCERLAASESIVVPVSLHYFMKDGDQPRAIPAAVEARTNRYREALPARCEARAQDKVSANK